MSNGLKQAVEELEKQLSEQESEVVETKKLINALYLRMGEAAPFSDLTVASEGRALQNRPDLFFGKPFATAVEMILRSRGHAVASSEIADALLAGGYVFRDEIAPNRAVPIRLGKNTAKFVSIPNTDSFGLLEWYPEVQKTRRAKSEKGSVQNGNDEPNDAIGGESEAISKGGDQ